MSTTEIPHKQAKRNSEQIAALLVRARNLIDARRGEWEEVLDDSPGQRVYCFGDPDGDASHVITIPDDPAALATLHQNRRTPTLIATLCDCRECASGDLEELAFILRTRPDLRKAVNRLVRAARIYGPFEIAYHRGHITAGPAK